MAAPASFLQARTNAIQKSIMVDRYATALIKSTPICHCEPPLRACHETVPGAKGVRHSEARLVGSAYILKNGSLHKRLSSLAAAKLAPCINVCHPERQRRISPLEKLILHCVQNDKKAWGGKPTRLAVQVGHCVAPLIAVTTEQIPLRWRTGSCSSHT